MRLGVVNVERDILRGLTAKQFRAWEQYYELDPFGEIRQDYRIASIVQMLYNINRGKGQQPGKLEEFVLKFGEQAEKPKQTPQQQFAMLKILAAMHANDPDVTPAPPGAEPGRAQVEAAMARGDITFAEPTAAEQDAMAKARAAMKQVN